MNSPQTMPYRGRIAPSPTGYLHLGHARTFWTAHQRAVAANGTLIFRDEDLDRQRCRAEFVQAMYEDLTWFGIRWQEGPDIGGPFAPYRQSERYSHYFDTWRKLVNDGYIYPCSCSRKDLAGALQAPHEGLGDDEPIYPGTCRAHIDDANSYETPDGVSWRFRVPDGEAIHFNDLNLGPQQFVAGIDFGDFLIWRRDGIPSYQLAVVADDAAIQVTEIVRGADLLKSTARQIQIGRALGLPLPAYYHCALMTDAQGIRLAKRHDALSLRALRSQGASPEQLRASW